MKDLDQKQDYTTWETWSQLRIAEALAYYGELEGKGALSKEKDFFIQRTSTIGGSDIGTLLGLNKYQTPMQLFASKTMRVPPFGGNFATRCGQMMEAFIYNELPYTLKGAKLLGPQYRVDPEHPWRTAQIDNTAYIPQWDCVVNIECKKMTPSLEWGAGSQISDNGELVEGYFDDLIPKSYYAQCLWGLAVGLAADPNAPKTTLLLAWAPIENKIRIYVIKFEPEMVQYLTEYADKFVFENLIPDIPPAPTSSEVTELYKVKVPSKKDGKAEKNVWADGLDLAVELHSIKEKIAELKEQESQLQDELCSHIGDFESVWANDSQCLATWKAFKSSRFDSTRFKKEHPDIYEQYVKESTTRRFLLKY